jgi:hypothetical protein
MFANHFATLAALLGIAVTALLQAGCSSAGACSSCA